MGPQDGRTDFMFYYANLCTISGLFASSFLAFFERWLPFLFLFSVRVITTRTSLRSWSPSDPPATKSRSRPDGPAERPHSFTVCCLLRFYTHKGLGSFQLLGLFERLRILGSFRIFGCHFCSSIQFALF
jgi:hypothetical protein